MKPDIQQKIEEQLRTRLMTLPDFAVDYLFQLEFRKKELRTRIEYAKDLSLFFHYLVETNLTTKTSIMDITVDDLKKLKQKDIAMFLSYLTSYVKHSKTRTGKQISQRFTNSSKGKARKLASLHDFFDYLVDNQDLSIDVTKKIDIKISSQAKLKTRLTATDMKRFYATILDDLNITSSREEVFQQKLKLRNYTIILILSYTGIRISELTQLDISDVSIQLKAMVIERKGGEQERINVPERILEDIEAYLEERKNMEYDTPALFVSLHRKRIDTRTVREMIHKYRKRAGIEINVTPHVFRRTFGTKHYNKYRDMYLTAQIMGHNSAETTRKFYADPDEERVRQSMETFDYDYDDSPPPPPNSNDMNMDELMKVVQSLEKTTGKSFDELRQSLKV